MTERLHYGTNKTPETYRYTFLDANEVPVTFGSSPTAKLLVWRDELLPASDPEEVTTGVGTPDAAGYVDIEFGAGDLLDFPGRHWVVIEVTHGGDVVASEPLLLRVTPWGP